MFRFNLLMLLIVTLAASAFSQGSWTTRRPGDVTGDLEAVYFTSSSRGFVAGDKGYLASTSDGGQTWQSYPLGTTEDINEIYFRNENNGYLVAGKQMFVTHDGGRSWQGTRIYRSSDFPTGTPEFLSIKFADKKRGIAIGSLSKRVKGEDLIVDSVVMRTEDGGDTWQRVIVPSRKELFHLDFSGSSRVWIVGDDGAIIFSNDSGATWSLQRSGTIKALYSVDFRDDNEGYTVGADGTILRTEDGGSTWIAVPTNFRQTLMRVDFADDKNGWIVGHSGTILRSADRGKTWEKQPVGTTADLYGLYMSKKYGCAVGAKGTIVEYGK